MSEYTATIKLRADRSGLTGELKIATADIAKLNDELKQSGAAGSAGAAGVKKHGDETQRAADGTRRLNGETKSLREQFGSLKTMLATLGVYTVGREMMHTLAAFQDTRTMIQGLTSGAREYAKTQEYLIDVSDRYSGNLNTVSESYARLLALKEADIITTGESRELLEGLLNAGAQLKASNEQIGLVYYGLAQALSQAKVQAQELNQIVEPLPGILNYMDKAAGLDPGGFRRMVMNGEVTSQFFKENMIVALENYNGAAEKTYENISAVSRRVSNQHTLLVAQLEAPIDSTVGAVLSGYEIGLKALIENLPDLIELMKDTATMAGMLVGVSVAAWLYRLAAASIATHGAFTLLELRMMATMATARLTTSVLAGLGTAMGFVGGLAGIAVLAGTAIHVFGTRSDEAALATARLKGMVDGLSESMSTLTVADLDSQLAESQRSLADLQTAMAGLQAPVQPTGFDSLVTTGRSEAMAAYKQKVADYGQLQEYWTLRIEQLEGARAEAVEASAKEQADAVTALTEKQQELLDKYLPLEKLAREYQAELTTLSAIEAVTTEEAQRKASAIAVLTAVYEQEVKEISGVTKAEEEAQKVREKTLQQMTQLIDEYAPLQNSQVNYVANLTLLTQARDEDMISLTNYHAAVAALAQEQYNSLNPGAEVITQLQAELTALRLTGDELEYYNRTQGMSAEQVAKHGASIRALIVDMREEQGGLDALEASQKAYQQSTETMLDDLQRSWGNLFQELLRGGKITMRDLSSTVLDIWASTIARMSSMQMSNAFQGALTPSSSNTAAAVAGSGGSINWGQLAGVVGGGVSSVLSASMIKSSAPIYEGGQLISEGAKSLNLSLANLGTNLLAGYAGGKLGTMAGEAITGKTAQSNYGAMAGAVIGAFVPVIGPFLGALAGGALDAVFGGDSYKRSSVGFDTGRDSVRDSYYTGTQTFESGLTVNKINRRGDAEAMDAITAKGAEIDAYITNAARAAGARLNMAGKNLTGTSADYGRDSGTFTGMRVGDGQDSEEALDAMFANFSRQLIGHIEGLSADVTEAMLSASGTADEVLQQFQDALALDQLVKSGALDVLGTQVSFTFAQQLSEAAGGLDNLSAATAAFNNSVADSATAQSNVVERLRTAVDEQFTAINLTLTDYSSVAEFRVHFDDVKDSLSAVDVLKLVQAGNALALLIEQEEQLVEVRSAGMAEQLDSAQELIDIYKGVRAQANALAGTIANDIHKIAGTGVTDLRARLRVGTYDEQLDVIDQLRQQILANYNDELQIKQDLHADAMDRYEQQRDAARSLSEYIQGVMTGDLSPLSVADRLTTAQQQFDDVVQRALSGDLSAGEKASDYFDTLAKLNQQANASSITGVTAFYANLEKLQSVQGLLSQAQAPAALAEASIAAPYLLQLQELQTEVLRVQTGTAVDLVDGLGSLKLLLENLPAKMAAELASLLPGQLSSALQIGTNLGLLSTDIKGALGLLPQKIDLSSSGIANQIEAVTMLSQHPAIMAVGIGTLSQALGAMMQQLVANGASTHLLADILSRNPATAAAANQYLADNNLGSLPDYTSAVNTNYSNQAINDYVQSAIAAAADEESAVRAIMTAASAANIGSGQLASATGYSQEDILALAAKYGYNSFDVGTDRVTHDQLANVHTDEIIFNPRESGDLRRAVVERVSGGDDSATMTRLVKAVEAQSRLLEELVASIATVSGEQQQAFKAASGEVTEVIGRLIREIEELAA